MEKEHEWDFRFENFLLKCIISDKLRPAEENRIWTKLNST